MDSSWGPYGKPTLAQKARRIYGRLTTKGKVVFAVIGLLFLYLIFPSWGSSKIENDGFTQSHSRDTGDFDNNQYNTVSDLLNLSPGVSPVQLQYLSIPPFLNSKNEIENYINGGSMLLSRSANYVRLVRDIPKQTGFLFSRLTISPDDLSAIEATVEFKIHGAQEKQGIIGDGMAIWFTTEQLSQGDVFGVQSNYNGLGLFVDTYKNYNHKKNRHSFPYLSLQRNRGMDHFYEKEKDGIDTQFGGCALHRIYNNNDKHTKLKFTYLREAGVVEIDLDINGDGSWRTCFRKENLGVDDLFPVGRPLYFGVSAETGELHHNVDIYGLDVKTYRNKDGGIITSLESLGEGIRLDGQTQESIESKRRESGATRRKRRSLERLRRQEKKLKEQDKQKYGSEHGFVGWFFGLVWRFIKVFFYLVLVISGFYACVIGYRVFKDKQRKKNSGGLL